MYHGIEINFALRLTGLPKRLPGLLKRAGNIAPQVEA